MSETKLVELGVSNKPHGIKGATLFKLHNPKESVLKKGSVVTLFPLDSGSSLANSGEDFTIESINFGNKVICVLEEVRDRNHLEELLPLKIMYPRELFPEIKEEEFYISDIVGCKVFDTEDRCLGEVVSEYDNGVQSVISMMIQGKKIELPFVENFFLEVDIENKKIVVVVPEFI